MAIYNSTVKQRLPSVGIAYMNYMREYVSYYKKFSKINLILKDENKWYAPNFTFDRVGEGGIRLYVKALFDRTYYMNQYWIPKSQIKFNYTYGFTVDNIPIGNDSFYTEVTIKQDNNGIYFTTDNYYVAPIVHIDID